MTNIYFIYLHNFFSQSLLGIEDLAEQFEALIMQDRCVGVSVGVANFLTVVVVMSLM